MNTQAKMRAQNLRRILAVLMTVMTVVSGVATAQDALFKAAINGDAAQFKTLLDKGAKQVSDATAGPLWSGF